MLLSSKLEIKNHLVGEHENQTKWHLHKVETPIHDNIRELVTWECKEHGVKSWVLGLESEFLEAWVILHKFLKQGTPILTHRLIQNKQKNNYEAT
jgi:hypothetical protein